MVFTVEFRRPPSGAARAEAVIPQPRVSFRCAAIPWAIFRHARRALKRPP